MANQFFIQPAQFGQGLQALAGSVQEFGQQQQQEQRSQEAQKALAAAVQSGDPAAIRDVVVQYPEVGERAKQAFGFTNEQTEKIARETYRQALSEPDPARRAQIMQSGIEQVSQFGGQPRMMSADLQTLQQNPEAFDRSAKAGYAALATDEEFEAMFGDASGAGSQFGTVNPRDFTPESLSRFQQTGDYSDLVRYESKRSVDIGGVPHVFDPSVGGYVPASMAGRGAGGQAGVETQGRTITAEDVAGSEATIAGARERAKQEVKAQSPTERRKQDEAVRSARMNIASSQDIIRQADTFLSNPDYIEAVTGIRGKLPKAPGTEGFDAEIAFDQFKDTLTLGNLDKMSGVLSETDIKILSSAASGLEYGMSEPALKSRLSRIREVFADKTEQERKKLTEMMKEGGEGAAETQRQAPAGSPKTVNWGDLP